MAPAARASAYSVFHRPICLSSLWSSRANTCASQKTTPEAPFLTLDPPVAASAGQPDRHAGRIPRRRRDPVQSRPVARPSVAISLAAGSVLGVACLTSFLIEANLA